MADAAGDDGRRAIFREAGRRARDEAVTISRMAEAMRLASFRSYIASAVDMMPAILPDVTASIGLSLAEAVQRLRPTAAWPACAGRNVEASTPRPLPSFVALGRRWSATTAAGNVHAHPSRIGSALLADGALTDWVEIVACGRWLEVAMRSDAFELATHEGAARLKLEGRLPEVVLATCAGRRLDEVVDLPLLRGRSLLIDTAGVSAADTVLRLRVGGASVAFPWRD
ncbi:hypothetical protein [Sphingomonas sp. CLY1604]|uniref:hypothetical protein n=1 Tax=Sphingomonas sp. CLY1604 TaxID=3457786 RepID=UPI003FD6D51F